MKSYSFVTTWRMRAKLSDVWEVLMHNESWPQWWKGVKEVKVLRQGDAMGLGSISFYEMGTSFYTLKFMIKIVELEKEHYIAGVAEGDLIGTGLWELTEENGIVIIKYYWDVETTIPWMNRWAWLLRPFFRISHNAVMKWGGKGMAKKLGTKLL